MFETSSLLQWRPYVGINVTNITPFSGVGPKHCYVGSLPENFVKNRKINLGKKLVDSDISIAVHTKVSVRLDRFVDLCTE